MAPSSALAKRMVCTMSGFGQMPESFVVNVAAANDFIAFVLVAAMLDEVIDRLTVSPAANVIAPARSQRVALIVLVLLFGLVEGRGKIGSALSAE